jgi:hypothetical protein
MLPRQILDKYFSSVRARDIEAFMVLFAEDATFITPDGSSRTGADAIREMETAVFNAANPPTPSPRAIVADETSAAVEVEVRLPNGAVHHMGSFFQFDQSGLIQRLSIYRQAN